MTGSRFLFLFISAVCLAVNVRGGEPVRLVSIAEMKRFVAQSGTADLSTLVLPEELQTPGEPTVDTGTGIDPTAAGLVPELPEFTLEDAELPAVFSRVMAHITTNGVGDIGKWMWTAINDYKLRNDWLAAARLMLHLDLVSQAASEYRKVLQSGGATQAERQEVASGKVGIEYAFALGLLGHVKQARSVLTTGMEEAQGSGDAALISAGEQILTSIDVTEAVLEARSALGRMVRPTPATLEEKRAEAARLIALSCLYSSSTIPIGLPSSGGGGGNTGGRGGGGNTGGGNAPSGPGAALLSMAQVPSTNISPFDNVYPGFNRTASIEGLAGYKDADAIRGVIEGLDDTKCLRGPRQRAVYLAELILRFPGHQVVKEGEAAYVLIKAVAESGSLDLASKLAEAAVSAFKDSQPARDGEFVYMAAEFAFYRHDWQCAHKLFKFLRAGYPEHRAVPLGIAGARVRMCTKRMRDSGLTVIGE